MAFIEQVKADVPEGFTKINVLNKDQEAAGFYVYVQPSFRNLGQKTVHLGKQQFIQNENGSYLAGTGTDEQGRQKAQVKAVWNCVMEMDVKMAAELIKTLEKAVISLNKK